ncbi:MAG: phosphotransferase [Pseudomonadota bacterium]
MLDDSTLRQAALRTLSAWDLEVDSVAFFSQSENIVLRAETSTGTYALRLHRPGYHSLEELNSEILLHDMVRAAGLETPAALKTQDGQYYTQIEMPNSGESRYAGLSRWMNGTVLEAFIESSTDAATRRGYFQQLGQLMATLHNYAAKWTPPPQFVRHRLDEDGLAGATPFWGRFWEASPASSSQKAILETARSDLYEFLSALDKGPERFNVIHADLHPGNILVDADQVTIFDFDDAGFGWFLYDVATALFDSWYEDDDYQNTLAAVIEGYAEQRPFTDEMRETLPKFLLMRMLAYVGWLNDRPETAGYGELPDLIADACERASGIFT